jgi:short-subunit dehydrogenase
MKTFLSIGSGPGIGASTAERFAREGYRIVLSSRSTEKLAERAGQLAAKGYQVETRAVDAGDLASVTALVREVETQFGAIDVLHFNAASMRAATMEQQDPATFVPDLTVNIGAALVAVQEASRGMLARRSGTILLTGGGFALAPSADYLSLSIGKAGIRAMAHALFAPFRDRNVHIGSVTVATLVAAESKEAQGVAEAFWNLHDASPENWVAEVSYPD